MKCCLFFLLFLGQLSWAQKVYIMLDIDGTVSSALRGRSDRFHPLVQSIQYQPDEAERLRLQNLAEKKVSPLRQPVYVWNESTGVLNDYLVVKPSIEALFGALQSELEAGRVEVLVTSSNFSQRTQAVFNQVKVSQGKTLKEWGARYVDRTFFQEGEHKDLKKLRQSLQLSAESWVYALDDRGPQIRGLGPRDRLVTPQAWTAERVHGFLAGHNLGSFWEKDQARLKALLAELRAITGSQGPCHLIESIQIRP